MADSTSPEIAAAIIEGFAQTKGARAAAKFIDKLDDMSVALDGAGKEIADLVLTDFIEDLSNEFMDRWGPELLGLDS